MLSFKASLISYFKLKLRDGTYIKSIFFMFISSMLCISFISDGVFETCDDTRVLFLMMISLCVWNGLFNSISDIAKAKEVIIKDFELKLSILSFLLAQCVIQIFICILESIILFAVVMFTYEFPNNKLIFDTPFVDYYLTILIVLIAADFMGIMISSLAILLSDDNPFSFTMTVVPLVLLIQLLLSNILVSLKGEMAEFISNFSICKWGVLALENIVDINNYPRKITLIFVDAGLEFPDVFSVAENNTLLEYWFYMILFSIVCFIVTYLLLNIRMHIGPLKIRRN